MQVGIFSSASPSACDDNRPMKYTRVYSYRKWIERITNENIDVKVTVFENLDNKVFGFYDEL